MCLFCEQNRKANAHKLTTQQPKTKAPKTASCGNCGANTKWPVNYCWRCIG